NGTIDLYLNTDKKQTSNFSQEQELSVFKSNFPIKDTEPLSIINAEITLDSEKKQVRELLLVPRGNVRMLTEEHGGKTVYIMDNGI
ncbi:hypothetical protein OSJ97_25225, partial [Escherichia coli]|nr:hypothetical protein [Escherichia coli]